MSKHFHHSVHSQFCNAKFYCPIDYCGIFHMILVNRASCLEWSGAQLNHNYNRLYSVPFLAPRIGSVPTTTISLIIRQKAQTFMYKGDPILPPCKKRGLPHIYLTACPVQWMAWTQCFTWSVAEAGSRRPPQSNQRKRCVFNQAVYKCCTVLHTAWTGHLSAPWIVLFIVFGHVSCTAFLGSLIVNGRLTLNFVLLFLKKWNYCTYKAYGQHGAQWSVYGCWCYAVRYVLGSSVRHSHWKWVLSCLCLSNSRMASLVELMQLA